MSARDERLLAAGDFLYLHHGHLGSVTATTDHVGSILGPRRGAAKSRIHLSRYGGRGWGSATIDGAKVAGIDLMALVLGPLAVVGYGVYQGGKAVRNMIFGKPWTGGPYLMGERPRSRLTSNWQRQQRSNRRRD